MPLSRVTNAFWLWRAIVIVPCCLLTLAACSTHSQRLIVPRQSFYTNDLPQAQTQLAKLASKGGGDAQVVELDLAIVDLLQGNPAGAEKRLREVRDQFDHLEQKSLTEATLSLMTDDRRRAYSGEDYEKLLIRVFLSLASLMQDGVDAESYALQALDKHEQLRIAAQERWGNSIPETYCVPAVAPYLRGLMSEASMSNYDDALRGYTQGAALLPDATFLQADMERAAHGVHRQTGHGV